MTTLPYIENQCDTICNWLGDNNLYLNKNKGKTEFVLFGTPQRLSKAEKIEILINEFVVPESSQYTYFDVMQEVRAPHVAFAFTM